ncbi:hypothetical protein [Aquimarina macrocephali]|uniref:hypothetical protein n=1 Tax=Aquimarina macrocephali TaxID=666563 RepID=UPI00046647B9|nr:hypothetical protein [Aquimarina macrocephali]
MKEIEEFLNHFFEEEQKILNAYLKPNLENYNNTIDNIARFVVSKLENGFGAKLNSLRDDSFYERVKNFPSPQKRFLFRIDQYETDNNDHLYHCFASDSNPDDWKSYLNSFVVGKVGGELKILSMFFFSDKGMGGEKKWHFNAGEDKFMNKENGQYLLNIESLGDRIEINRITEPSDDADSMKEYNKD